MAWDEVKQTMSFREEILSLGAQEGTNIRELCRRFRVSTKTFYKWLKRSKAGGTPALQNRSRRPHRSPRRSEEHTSELQSLRHLVCRLLLEKKKIKSSTRIRNSLVTFASEV